MKVCALYVLYHPDWDYLFRSISSLADSADAFYFYANSEISEDKIQLLSSCASSSMIIGSGDNVGIAAALNELCRVAISEGFFWAITMDQDSLMPSGFVKEYIDFINKNESLHIGIVCPNFKLGDNSIVKKEEKYVELDKTITSGACMNLKTFQEVGGFMDELFIDSVDTEYSWKLHIAGYKIYRLLWLVLEHHIGQDPFDFSIFGKRLLTVDNHNYIRCYYITRNSLFLNKLYRKQLPRCVQNNRKALKLFIKVLLFEKDKKRKIRSIFWGVVDYKRNKLGKYNH